MISPPPTQQMPAPEHKARYTPARKRRGDTRSARIVKAIIRPPIKLLYHTIQIVRGHKWATLGVLLLLLLSISVTTYATTGDLPFGVGRDPFNFHINGSNSAGDHVKNWLYALRDGNTTKLSLLQSELIMSQPPDPGQLVSQYSQTQGHLTWKSINVIGTYSQPDTTLESFVAVDFTAAGPGGENKGVMIWHFTTLPSAQGRLLFIDLVTVRPYVQ